MTMSRALIFVGYLGLLLPVVLLWCSPWLPPEGPPVKRRIRIRHLMILVAVIALLLAWVRAVFQAALADFVSRSATSS